MAACAPSKSASPSLSLRVRNVGQTFVLRTWNAATQLVDIVLLLERVALRRTAAWRAETRPETIDVVMSGYGGKARSVFVAEFFLGGKQKPKRIKAERNIWFYLSFLHGAKRRMDSLTQGVGFTIHRT